MPDVPAEVRAPIEQEHAPAALCSRAGRGDPRRTSADDRDVDGVRERARA